ncbi:MAG: hypothetical protein ACFCUI_00410 [Bernardetiaceae bacterium]
MRNFRWWLLFLLTEGLLLLGLWGRAAFEPPTTQGQLTQRLLLTDFVFSTESRHTRHLHTPEWMAAFQDFPAYLDHFPSSSFFYAKVFEPDTVRAGGFLGSP